MVSGKCFFVYIERGPEGKQCANILSNTILHIIYEKIYEL